MTEERRKEIALLVVEQMVIERGVPAKDILRREVGNIAKKIGVESSEIMDFYLSMLPKILSGIFGGNKTVLDVPEKRKFQVETTVNQ